MSKTIRWPSGETSSEIQVPLVVVNSCVRVAFSGSVCGGVGAAPAAGAPWAGSATAVIEANVVSSAKRERQLSIGRIPLWLVRIRAPGMA